jgi:NTE family protein
MADGPHIKQQIQMKKKKISIALQGGGAHAAFTWGVMEKLLEEDLLDIRGFSGTSAGAVTSVLITHGLQKNGTRGACEMLELFWKEIAAGSALGLTPPNWLENHFFNGNLDFTPWYQSFNNLLNLFSPYQFNPLGINPLRNILGEMIDFDQLKQSHVKLFVAATKVKDGSLKIFCLPEINLDVLLASTCLPYLTQSAEVDGEFYWDGGYTGNPPIYPLIYGTDSKDIMLIQLNPIVRDQLPESVTEIQNRINEISFNASLEAEMRMLMRGYDLAGKVKDTFFHLITVDQLFKDLNFSSKLNTSWEFLNRLREEGHKAAELWLKTDFPLVGNANSPLLNKMGAAEEHWLEQMVHNPAKHLKENAKNSVR